MPPLPEWMADLASKSGELGASAKEKAERDARWIGDWSDELTVAVALREWDKAVALVEEGELKLSIMPTLTAKLNPLKASLTAALLQSLSVPSNKKSTVVSLIGLLLKLKAGPAARSTFLAARADVIRKCVRKITFEGHIGSYIADLATVVFTGIKHTADWFLASFRENEVASSKCTRHCTRSPSHSFWFRFRGVGEATDRVIRRDVSQTSVQLRCRAAHDRRRDPNHPCAEQEAPGGVRHRLPLPPRQPPSRNAQGARPPARVPRPHRAYTGANSHALLHACPLPLARPRAPLAHALVSHAAYARIPGPCDACARHPDAGVGVPWSIAPAPRCNPATTAHGELCVVPEPDAKWGGEVDGERHAGAASATVEGQTWELGGPETAYYGNAEEAGDVLSRASRRWSWTRYSWTDGGLLVCIEYLCFLTLTM